MRLKTLVCLLGAFISGGTLAAEEPAAFAIGQTWSYATRAGEESSSLTILAADADTKEGMIYHVAVVDLKLKRVAPASGSEPWQMTVAAFNADALRRSVTRLQSTGEPRVVPGFEKSYATWKKQKAAGKHRYWTLPVAAAVEQLEAMILKGRRS